MYRPVSKNGFTLIEVLIVMVILTIISAQAYLSSSNNSVSLAEQVRQLVSDLRFTQALAMTKGSIFGLAPTSNTSYQIYDVSATPVTLPTGGNTRNFINGVTFTNFPNELIVFDGLGQPYASSTVASILTTPTVITLNAGNSVLSVTIQPYTGMVSIQ